MNNLVNLFVPGPASVNNELHKILMRRKQVIIFTKLNIVSILQKDLDMCMTVTIIV